MMGETPLDDSFRVDVKYVYEINMRNRKFELKKPYLRVCIILYVPFILH